jgi:hypothetical protein
VGKETTIADAVRLETCKYREAAKNHCGSDPSRGLFIERS